MINTCIYFNIDNEFYYLFIKYIEPLNDYLILMAQPKQSRYNSVQIKFKNLSVIYIYTVGFQLVNKQINAYHFAGDFSIKNCFSTDGKIKKFVFS